MARNFRTTIQRFVIVGVAVCVGGISGAWWATETLAHGGVSVPPAQTQTPPLNHVGPRSSPSPMPSSSDPRHTHAPTRSPTPSASPWPSATPGQSSPRPSSPGPSRSRTATADPPHRRSTPARRAVAPPTTAPRLDHRATPHRSAAPTRSPTAPPSTRKLTTRPNAEEGPDTGSSGPILVTVGNSTNPRGTGLIVAGLTGIVVSITGLVTVAIRRRR